MKGKLILTRNRVVALAASQVCILGSGRTGLVCGSERGEEACRTVNANGSEGLGMEERDLESSGGRVGVGGGE